MGGGGSLHPHGGSQPFPNLSLLNFIGTRHTHGTCVAHAVHICTGSQNMNALIHKPDISKNGKKLGMGEGRGCHCSSGAVTKHPPQPEAV